MGKIFIDKILLDKFSGQNNKVIAIFHNDVQRKGKENISFTLVSGLFMVYTQFLSPLVGVYYLDIPRPALNPSLSRYIKPFSRLISDDIHELFSS